jgi:hypothetical protein
MGNNLPLAGGSIGRLLTAFGGQKIGVSLLNSKEDVGSLWTSHNKLKYNHLDCITCVADYPVKRVK